MNKDVLIEMGVPEAEAVTLQALMQEWDGQEPLVFWQRMCGEGLKAAMPFDVHKSIHEQVFAQWKSGDGPVPGWSPTGEQIRGSNIGQLMEQTDHASYESFYSWSIEQPEEFVSLMLKRLGIVFEQEPERILNLDDGVESARWLTGGKLNLAQSCFLADPDAIAVVTQDQSGEIIEYTYAQLLELTGRVVNSLAAMGTKPGDRIGMAMAMTFESVGVYLGIISAGGSAVTVAESFSSEEMRVRFELAKPLAVFTQDHLLRLGKMIPMYEKVVSATSVPCIVTIRQENESQVLREQDTAWNDFLKEETQFSFVMAESLDELTLLFSSGTTGNPKAIPWNHCTPIKSANDAHLHHDIHPGDKVCWPTSLGWMMGPWLVFSSLINKAAIALSTDAPTTTAFGTFIQDAGITMLGLVPSLVSAWRSLGCIQGLDWSAIRAFSSTGECSNAEDMLFLMSLAGYKPVIEYCGGTETGGGYITGTVVQPSCPGTFSTPALGFNWCLLDESDQVSDKGEVFFIPPVLGLSITLVNRDHYKVYFEGTPPGPDGAVLRRHGDQIEKLPGNYYKAHGRVDDAMNLSGIKVSSVQIEELLSQCEGVDEAAAIAVPPPGGGPGRLIIYAVVSGRDDIAELKKDMQSIIRGQLNPLFKIHDAVQIDKLPRTASNKVMRRLLRAKYEEQEK